MQKPWVTPSTTPELSADEVHVWRASLALPGAYLSRYYEWLSPDERERADRFRFPKHRGHFIAGRGFLREILARYTGAAPRDLRFEYGPHGKPSLAGAGAAAGIRFNMSHSGGLALYAVTWGGEVGVDVERFRPEVECEKIAHRFFSPAEVEALFALPAEARRTAFFLCWSRKEAYIKALGTGLALPLDEFDVSLHPDQPAALLGARHDPEALHRWRLWSLDPGPGYAGALVTEGNVVTVRCWEWAETR